MTIRATTPRGDRFRRNIWLIAHLLVVGIALIPISQIDWLFPQPILAG